MAVALEQFVKQLEDSGILAEETLKDFLPPKGDAKNAEDLARELVRKKKLTKFQAEEAYKGKAKSLVLGNYMLLEKIGAGGMGQVFKARHRRMDRLVAVKLLPAAMTKDQAAIARFEREVKAAAKLRHPNIVAADDADQANGVHFLVMELVEGSDLSALVKKSGPFPVDKGVNYILQAAKGLEAAHAEGIVHRDIKPANLLLDKKGTVKILDMGLARLSNDGDAPAQAELTSTGTIMGTVDYMSPEQALNTKAADARADVYSLGCSLYYLLTGKATYDGETLTARLLAHQSQPIPSLRASCPDVSQQLETIFNKMVAKKMEERYQSMTEVIADLEQCAPRAESSSVVQSSSAVQTSAGSSTDVGLGSFRSEFTVVTNQPAPAKPVSIKTVPTKKESQPKLGKDQKKLLLIGGSVLGVLAVLVVLAVVVISMQTKDGTLVVTVNEPGAQVQVLDEKGKVEITRKGEKGPITISVDPGKHRLKVTKDGFEFFTKDFEIESGGKQPITAKLVPLEDKSAVATTAKPGPPAKQPPTWTGWPKDTPPPAIAPFDATQAKKHQEAWAKHLGVPVEYTNTLGMKFMLIPPGEFLMGSTTKEIEGPLLAAAGDDGTKEIIGKEVPQHKVVLTKPFYLGVHEVTQAQYQKVMGENPSRYAATSTVPWAKELVVGLDTSSFPVEMVAWNNAAEFCAKASQQEKLLPFYSRVGETVTILAGNGYRLPTEAEWEFACRAGTTGLYGSGDREQDLAGVAWYLANSANRTHQVGELKGNAFGLYDMHGNAWEWVQDNWEPNYYAQFRAQTAINPDFESQPDAWRVLRGGGIGNPHLICRAAQRYPCNPQGGYTDPGFRVALMVDAVKTALTVGRTPTAAANVSPQPAVLGKHTDINDPAFQQWMKDVQAMPADKQLEAVSKKLQDLNQGFDGKLGLDYSGAGVPKVENGVVTELQFFTDNVADVSPVRALVGLKSLTVGGSKPGAGKLADLSPLKGLPLTLLACFRTQVSDLTPLQGMPLKELHLDETQVTDLSPLKGMSLSKLHFSSTQVSSLAPLKGMELTDISFPGAKVSDLSPLSGMPLVSLDCWGTPVADLSALKGMKLTFVSFSNATDVSVLRGMPLYEIKFSHFKPERDTEIFKSIKTLVQINFQPAADFWKEVEEQQKVKNP